MNNLYVIYQYNSPCTFHDGKSVMTCVFNTREKAERVLEFIDQRQKNVTGPTGPIGLVGAASRPGIQGYRDPTINMDIHIKEISSDYFWDAFIQMPENIHIRRESKIENILE